MKRCDSYHKTVRLRNRERSGVRIPVSTSVQQFPHFLHEFGGVLELPVHRSESDIGDLIRLSQFIHNHLTDVLCADLAIRETIDPRFDVLGHGLDLIGGDGALVAGDLDAVENLCPYASFYPGGWIYRDPGLDYSSYDLAHREDLPGRNPDVRKAPPSQGNRQVAPV